MNNKIIKISSYIGLFLVLTSISYLTFDKVLPVGKDSFLTSPQGLNSKKTGVEEGESQDSLYSGPKTEVCPINGALFTKEEKDIWSDRRPLLVMIENHLDSRPQSGLQNADIVYEAVSEGGITRFMAVFYCGAVKGAENKYDVGPVRSARSYFLDIASEYSDYPLYNHVGGANCSAPKDPVTGQQSGPCTTYKKAQALEQITDYGWTSKGTWSDLSEFSLSYKVCRREEERTGERKATEHTMYCSTKELWNIAANRGLTNLTVANKNSWDKNYRTWLFDEKDQPSSSPSFTDISFDFWPGYKEYSVAWKYDKSSNSYIRYHQNNPHVDFNTGTPLTAKNIIVQYVKETRSVDSHMHNLYDMIGTGKGVVFNNGLKSEITWSKLNRTSRTIFKDASGKEVNLVPGTTWVEILPIGSKINYEGSVQS